GQLLGIFASSVFQRIAVFGLGGNDAIVVNARIAKPTELHGNEGNDTIVAGSRNDLVFGEEGNDNLYGSGGNDVLLGGSGNDHLYGGAGRDVLLGGSGIDRLYGQEGDDILIGGTTDYDTNNAALNAIVAQWSSNQNFS